MACLLYCIQDIFLVLVATFWTTYVSFDLGLYIRKVDVGVDSFLYPYFNKYVTFSIVFRIFILLGYSCIQVARSFPLVVGLVLVELEGRQEIGHACFQTYIHGGHYDHIRMIF